MIQEVRWWEKAECVGLDTEMFFPISTSRSAKHKSEARNAMGCCRVCPVVQECLRDALSRPIQHGVWGGTYAYQREQILREIKERKVCSSA